MATPISEVDEAIILDRIKEREGGAVMNVIASTITQDEEERSSPTIIKRVKISPRTSRNYLLQFPAPQPRQGNLWR